MVEQMNSQIKEQIKKEKCPDCDGNGICNYCAGEGVIDKEDCEYCDGSGNCQACQGEGEIEYDN